MKVTANRVLFGTIVGILVALVIAMLWLSIGLPGSEAGLQFLVAILIGAAAFVLLLRFARSTRG